MPRTASRKTRAKASRPALQHILAAARGTVTAGTQEAARLVAARVGEAQKAFAGRIEDVRARTTDTLGTVEKVFEQRVARAMKALGVPSAREVQALSREVSRLQDAVEQLRRRRARA